MSAALTLFWGQLEAKAFQEEYDVESFEDLSLPRYDSIHSVSGLRHVVLGTLRPLLCAARGKIDGALEGRVEPG